MFYIIREAYVGQMALRYRAPSIPSQLGRDQIARVQPLRLLEIERQHGVLFIAEA